MEENIIDLGEITVPVSWDDVKLKTFQELEKYYADKDKNFDLREVLHIMIDKDVDYVNSLPINIAEMIMDKMSFLQTSPNVNEQSNKIEIDGETYEVNVMEKMKTGEFVSANRAIESDKYNYAAILAIICRKQGEKYDSKFEAEEYEKRVKMFENTPITKIMPVLSFFLNSYITLETLSLMCSQVEDAISHIQKNIETSQNVGVLKKRYLKWRTNKLLKSLRSSKNI